MHSVERRACPLAGGKCRFWTAKHDPPRLIWRFAKQKSSPGKGGEMCESSPDPFRVHMQSFFLLCKSLQVFSPDM